MKLNVLKDFRKNEEGGILAFFLIMFLALVVGGGMAVDFMNSEYQRERVQDALDRGVLAAAAIGKASRAVTPTEIAAAEAQSVLIVKSYIEKAGYDPEAAGVTITPDFTLNSQRVDARSAFGVDTFFLRIAGIDTLGGNAVSGAFVSQNDIEISLVLDISGSMGGSKIRNLRTAGSNFVGNMLGGDRSDYTFISVIPFNNSVNMGAGTMQRFSNQWWHGYNGCANFTSTAYGTVAFNPNSGMEQAGHALNSSGNNVICTNQTALVYSNNIASLQAKITSLRPGGNTAGYIGMKWAMGLLDPSADDIVSDMIDDGLVSDNFEGRPSPYSDENTLKFIIFMSDGQMNTTRQYNSGGSRPYAKVRDEHGDLLPWNSVENADYWQDHAGTRPYFHSLYPRGSTPLLSACDAADDAGIIVFSIAYGLSPGSTADTVLANCASTPGHYYSVVRPEDLDEAFTSIEASIQRLQLTN